MGAEGAKWKQIGNAVCVHVSYYFAKSILDNLDINMSDNKDLFSKRVVPKYFRNLNNPKEKKVFNSPPKICRGGRFRAHTFKEGNMTVALTNHELKDKNRLKHNHWKVVIYFGTGRVYTNIEVNNRIFNLVKNFLKRNNKKFIKKFNATYSKHKFTQDYLQNWYERKLTNKYFIDPYDLVENVGRFITGEEPKNKAFSSCPIVIKHKKSLPLKQAMTIYCLYSLIN